MKIACVTLLALVMVACSAGNIATPQQTPPIATNIIPTPTPLPVAAPLASAAPTDTVEIPATPSAADSQLPMLPTTFPDVNQFEWRPFASGLDRPIGIWHADDSSGRLFVIEQAGVIRIIQDGKILAAPFLDIRERVGSKGNEQGLLGLAFHPDYQDNGYFYVNYTDKQGDTSISRFRVAETDADLADPTSEIRLLQIPQPYANHNGGEVAFGPDGLLYLGLGDGGAAGDPRNNAQSIESLLGKILRIDVDQGDTYTTPADNLFTAQQLPEIWAYGLRNPWRFSFDGLTGDLYIGDVGQNEWEEINFLAASSPAGANFGWKYMEGNHPYSSETPSADLILIPPIAEYDHSAGCSVTGGIVYRGSLLPEWNGIYLFGDFCSGRVSGLLRLSQETWQQQALFETGSSIAAFGEDESGEVYLVDLSGTIFRLTRK